MNSTLVTQLSKFTIQNSIFNGKIYRGSGSICSTKIFYRLSSWLLYERIKSIFHNLIFFRLYLYYIQFWEAWLETLMVGSQMNVVFIGDIRTHMYASIPVIMNVLMHLTALQMKAVNIILNYLQLSEETSLDWGLQNMTNLRSKEISPLA